MDPVAFDAINYMSYGLLGFFGTGLFACAALTVVNIKGKMEKQKNRVEEAVREMSGKLNENVFLLSQEELDIINVANKIIKENSFFKNFLFTQQTQRKYSVNDFDNESKYNVSKMILGKEWSLEARLLFVVEIINELEKECDNKYEDLHED